MATEYPDDEFAYPDRSTPTPKWEIFSYTSLNGKTRYLIAQWQEEQNQYFAYLDKEERRYNPSMYGVFAIRVCDLAGPTTTYAHRSSAVRALKREYTPPYPED